MRRSGCACCRSSRTSAVGFAAPPAPPGSAAPATCSARRTPGCNSVAPVGVDRLGALVERSKGRFRRSADYQLTFTPANRDWDGLVQEIQSVLQQIQQPRAVTDAREAVSGGV